MIRKGKEQNSSDPHSTKRIITLEKKQRMAARILKDI